MDDLVRWLEVQLDEDERIAKAAADKASAELATADRKADNFAPPYDGTHWGHDWDHVLMRDPRPGRMRKVMVADCGHGAAGLVAHIAEHDPARVLREISADRQLLAQYAAVAANDVDEVEYANGWAQALGFAVRLRASAYADRPGYREGWRP